MPDICYVVVKGDGETDLIRSQILCSIVNNTRRISIKIDDRTIISTGEFDGDGEGRKPQTLTFSCSDSGGVTLNVSHSLSDGPNYQVFRTGNEIEIFWRVNHWEFWSISRDQEVLWKNNGTSREKRKQQEQQQEQQEQQEQQLTRHSKGPSAEGPYDCSTCHKRFKYVNR